MSQFTVKEFVKHKKTECPFCLKKTRRKIKLELGKNDLGNFMSKTQTCLECEKEWCDHAEINFKS